MTPEQQYDKAADMSLKVSKLVNSYGEIAKYFPAIFWLHELYKAMVEKAEITEIKQIGSSRKLVYWTEVCLAAPERAKWIRIMACHACYMWDLIIEKVDYQGDNPF